MGSVDGTGSRCPPVSPSVAPGSAGATPLAKSVSTHHDDDDEEVGDGDIDDEEEDLNLNNTLIIITVNL